MHNHLTEEYNKGVSFRVPTMGFAALCRCIEKVPGVGFTKRRKFFWSGEDVGAEFVFRGHEFTISTDGWDGALWVMTRRTVRCEAEMQELRAAVERSGVERGFLGSLWRRFVTQTFT